MRDVTREVALEAQLRQAHKMEAIGGLAGGIAHDFNNMLTAIMANSEVMKHQLEDTHPAFEVPDEILRISKRAAALTRQLLAFSAKQEFDENPLNLREIIRSSYGMLKRLIREDIHIETEIDPELGLVKVDPNQIEQVIMNLMLNARDAVTDSGTITLARGLCRTHGERYGYRYCGRGSGAHFRAFFHHQSQWRRYRTGPGNGVRHCTAKWRFY
jgi:signal transduction histidine kinase